MATKLIAEIRSIQSDLPPVLQRIGKYVSENADRVVYQTITELGEETMCSLASIQRFYRQIGFQTYGDFKLRLATEIAASESRNTTGLSTRLDSLTEECIEALIESRALIDQNKIRPTAKKLFGSRRIMVFGVAASRVVAQFCHFKFLRIGKSISATADPHMAAVSLASMSSKDAIIVFSSSGSTSEALAAMELARKRGVWSLGVVNRSRSPLTDYLDEQIVVAAPESPLTGGSFAAKACQMLVVEALYQEALSMSKSARETDQTIAKIVSQHLY